MIVHLSLLELGRVCPSPAYADYGIAGHGRRPLLRLPSRDSGSKPASDVGRRRRFRPEISDLELPHEPHKVTRWLFHCHNRRITQSAILYYRRYTDEDEMDRDSGDGRPVLMELNGGHLNKKIDVPQATQ